MKARILVGVIAVPLLLLVLLVLPAWTLGAVVALISVLAAVELLGAAGLAKNRGAVIVAAALAMLTTLIAFFRTPEESLLATVGWLMMSVGMAILAAAYFAVTYRAFRAGRKIEFPAVVSVIFAGEVLPFFLSALVSLRAMEHGRLYVLLPFLAAFVTDAGAYFVGVFFGKRHAFPRVSPTKTVEGCLGGVAAGILAMALYGLILRALGYTPCPWSLLLYGVVGAVFTELGDLAFSLVKRARGI
jgi:phosphatidate cytidylyltransferase